MANRMVVKRYYTPVNVYASHHKVEVPVQLPMSSALAVEQDGRKVILAGTIYPSNDGNAQGVIANDYDVTEGDAAGAMCVHGAIKESALPVEVTAAAKVALNNICFKKAEYTGTITGTCLNPATIKASQSNSFTIYIKLDNAELRRKAPVSAFNIAYSNDGEEANVGVNISYVGVFPDDNSLAQVNITVSDFKAGQKIHLTIQSPALKCGGSCEINNIAEVVA